MYRKILVPIAEDDAPRTDAALEIARALLSPDGEIMILHVIEPVSGYVASYIPEETRKALHEETLAMMEAVAARAGHGVAAKVETGHGGRSIVERASEDGFDCIVIASHRPEFQDVLFGSTAAYVARHAPCAVHVLR